MRLLRELKRNSNTLDRIGSEFHETIRKHALHIYSFREEYETRKYVFFHSIVVRPDSAKIGYASEEVSSIPADHSNMSKFRSKDDAGFKRVSAQLSLWVDNIKKQEDGEIATQGKPGRPTPSASPLILKQLGE